MRHTPDSLRFIADYVSLAVEEDLTRLCKELCDPHPGTKRLSRQFALKFNHRTAQPTPPLPLQVSAPFILLRFIEDLEGLLEITVIQALLWVYPPETGIGQHIDQLALGEVVTTLSLACDSVMDFSWGGEGDTAPPPPFSIPLPRRSLLVMEGTARHRWMHGIRSENVPSTRVSITLRGMPNSVPPDTPTSRKEFSPTPTSIAHPPTPYPRACV